MITRRAALAMPLMTASLREAWATPQEANELVMKFTGGKEPARGRVSLAIPELIEDGHFVPLTVSVESPMTAEDRVESILIAAGANPWPGIAVFHFSSLSGEAVVKTRVRLAATQMVQAIAKMSDGRFYVDRRTVEVTIGGCAG